MLLQLLCSVAVAERGVSSFYCSIGCQKLVQLHSLCLEMNGLKIIIVAVSSYYYTLVRQKLGKYSVYKSDIITTNPRRA